MKAHLEKAPGLMLAGLVAGIAMMLEHVEAALFGQAWLEALVLAILLGTLVRTCWTPSRRFRTGIDCAAKGMLEAAIVLMGTTVSFSLIAAAGLPLLLAIILTVLGAIATGFLIGRLMGLHTKMALLVACGNAICGNSAIAAVAPVIDADGDDVATSIAFTAVLGIAVVIAVPFIAGALHMTPAAGGVLAGLTVYAVPQVIAAAGPLGSAAVQIGTLVKLVRVLMLGPVVAGLSLVMTSNTNEEAAGRDRTSFLHLMPPFIVAFLGLALLNSLGFISAALTAPAHVASGLLTVLAMAGLGLGVDLRSVAVAGPRVILVVTLSLLTLGGTAFAVLGVLHIR